MSTSRYTRSAGHGTFTSAGREGGRAGHHVYTGHIGGGNTGQGFLVKTSRTEFLGVTKGGTEFTISASNLADAADVLVEANVKERTQANAWERASMETAPDTEEMREALEGFSPAVLALLAHSYRVRLFAREMVQAEVARREQAAVEPVAETVEPALDPEVAETIRAEREAEQAEADALLAEAHEAEGIGVGCEDCGAMACDPCHPFCLGAAAEADRLEAEARGVRETQEAEDRALLGGLMARGVAYLDVGPSGVVWGRAEPLTLAGRAEATSAYQRAMAATERATEPCSVHQVGPGQDCPC